MATAWDSLLPDSDSKASAAYVSLVVKTFDNLSRTTSDIVSFQQHHNVW